MAYLLFGQNKKKEKKIKDKGNKKDIEHHCEHDLSILYLLLNKEKLLN